MRESWFFFVSFLCSLRAPCALFNLYSAFYRSKKKKKYVIFNRVAGVTLACLPSTCIVFVLFLVLIFFPWTSRDFLFRFFLHFYLRS